MNRTAALALMSVALLLAGPALAAGPTDPSADEAPPEAVDWLLNMTGLAPSEEGAARLWTGRGRLGWPWLAARHDVPADGAIDRKAFRGPADLFARLDRDGDGVLRAADFDWSDRSPFVQRQRVVQSVFNRLDSSGDARLTPDDLRTAFDRLAKGKESMTADDLRLALFPPAPPAAGYPAPWRMAVGFLRGELGSPYRGPEPGDPAPDFELPARDGGKPVRLSGVIGRRPVVLMFGNFTCGPFRTQAGLVDAVAKRYEGRADFLAVYVRDAHPADGLWPMPDERVGATYDQPRDAAGRLTAAGKCAKVLKLSIPMLVDGVDDRVGHLYSGMPDRLYVIDKAGRVAFKSGRGPFGFKPGEMEQHVALLLLEEAKP